MNSLFASTARGLEELLKTELEGAWRDGLPGSPGRGPFSGDTRLLYQSLMWSRLASRIMLPLGECRVYSDLGSVPRRTGHSVDGDVQPWRHLRGAF